MHNFLTIQAGLVVSDELLAENICLLSLTFHDLSLHLQFDAYPVYRTLAIYVWGQGDCRASQVSGGHAEEAFHVTPGILGSGRCASHPTQKTRQCFC